MEFEARHCGGRCHLCRVSLGDVCLEKAERYFMAVLDGADLLRLWGVVAEADRHLLHAVQPRRDQEL